VSLRTQELYAIVFLTRYLDLFFSFISLCVNGEVGRRTSSCVPLTRELSYNTVMKVIFITATLSIIWYMRKHKTVSQTYSKDEDTFRLEYLIVPSFLLALLVNHELSVMEARQTPSRLSAESAELTLRCTRCCGRFLFTWRRLPFCRSWSATENNQPFAKC
jgi:ER lumen protein retaining receptor